MNIKNKTYSALLQREVDISLAEDLVNKKYTLSKLQSLGENELLNLGLTKESIDYILNIGRPPIPYETIIQLLHKSKGTCCICRDNSQPIIFHHIKEWHKSKDHSEDNLVILCLNDHGKVHSQNQISQNYTPEKVKDLKNKWLEKVKYEDAKTLLGLSTSNSSARWDYININRLFELARLFKIKLSSADSFTQLVAYNMINKNGILNDPQIWKTGSIPSSHIHNCWEGMQLHRYLTSILEKVIAKLPIIDITNKWNKSEIETIIKPGDFICCDGAFYFKNLTKKRDGKDQTRICYRRAQGIRLEFTFDAFETTSTSSWATHLRGHTSVTPVCLVRSIEKTKDGILIKCSGLAIGSYFHAIPLFD